MTNLALNYRVSGGPWAIVKDRTTKWLVFLQGVNSACSFSYACVNFNVASEYLLQV